MFVTEKTIAKEVGVMNLQLKDIASIFIGVTFRSRCEPSPTGNVRVIQMKDLGDDNFVHLDSTIRVDFANPKGNHLAQANDIIFRSRGQVHTAALIVENVEDTIVAAPLFRIRVNSKKVLPEYLLWWINQPSAQRALGRNLQGSAVMMIDKKALEELDLVLPPLEQQEKIAKFFSLSNQEQSLLKSIKEHRAKYTQGILMRAVSSNNVKEY